jgi:hypothetical protein
MCGARLICFSVTGDSFVAQKTSARQIRRAHTFSVTGASTTATRQSTSATCLGTRRSSAKIIPAWTAIRWFGNELKSSLSAPSAIPIQSARIGHNKSTKYAVDFEAPPPRAQNTIRRRTSLLVCERKCYAVRSSLVITGGSGFSSMAPFLVFFASSALSSAPTSIANPVQ